MIVLIVSAALAAEWGPTQWPAPAEGVNMAVPEEDVRPGLTETLYRWYRLRSDQDGAQCSFYPTCSGYGILAIRQRGAVLGLLLTVDRVLREYPGMEQHDHYPVVTPHQTPRLHDPVPAGRRKR